MFTINTSHTIATPFAVVEKITQKTFKRNSILVGPDFLSLLLVSGHTKYGLTLVQKDNVYTTHEITGFPTIYPNGETFRDFDLLQNFLNGKGCRMWINNTAFSFVSLLPYLIDITQYALPQYDLSQLSYGDYIDCIPQTSVTNYAMSGYDKYNRPFIVINFQILEGEKYTQTFFQRYTDKLTCWMGADCDGSKQLFNTCGGMNDSQINLIVDL